MSTLPKNYLTPEEYLAVERAAERKSEYFDGQMFAMSGARRSHNLISVNAAGELNRQLRSRPVHGELYTRDPAGGWHLTDANQSEDVLELRSIGCTLKLADLYHKVEF